MDDIDVISFIQLRKYVTYIVQLQTLLVNDYIFDLGNA
jgi:hypothetical protein